MIKHSKFQTHTGVIFDLLDPSPDMVKIDDIAFALSHLCRWNGHHGWYSVAEHCVHASRLCYEHSLGGLMHDAQEAYTGDVISPMKRALRARTGHDPYSAFDTVEERIADVIASALDLYVYEPSRERRAVADDSLIERIPASRRPLYCEPEVERADLCMLRIEVLAFCPDSVLFEGFPWPYVPHNEIKIERWSPEQACEKFLARWKELT